MIIRTMLFIAAACVMIVAPGCRSGQPADTTPNDSSTSRQESARDKDRAAKDTATEVKDSILAKSEQEIENLKKRMDRLEKRASEEGGKMKQRWKNDVKPRMESQLKTAREKLADLRDSSENAWDKAKKDMQQALQHLRDTFAGAKSDVEEE